MVSEELFQAAMVHHQAGRLREAEAMYREILAEQPEDADVLQLLGIAVFHQGRMPEALELLDRAAGIDPEAPDYHCNRGMILSVLGRPSEAIAEIERALELKGDYVEAHYQLAHALGANGKNAEAIAAYRRALALRPEFAEAWNDMGVLVAVKRETDAAIEAFQKAVALRPDYLEGWQNLAKGLREAKRVEEEIAARRRVVELKPDSDDAFSELSYAYSETRRMEEALAAILKAVELRPDSAEAQSNLGTTYHKMGRISEAIASHRRALELNPQSAQAHLNLSLLYLLTDDYETGWSEYEWRWRVLRPIVPEPRFSRTMWDGSDLGGRRILLHPEGGYGDTIQFVRYAPLVAARGGQVVLGCAEELFRLLQTLDGVAELAVTGAEIPKFEVHCPLLSLPRVLKTTAENPPATVPYLHADASLVRRYQMAMEEIAAPLKVGLVWAGRPGLHEGGERSIPLARMARLAKIPNVSFFSLQKGAPAEQIRSLPVEWKLTDWTNELRDFADTAALVSNLDLIISIDTGMAHLCGAMGKPVWVFLPYVADWRWGMKGTRSAWYPTMRLFRQPGEGDWETPLSQVEAALRELAGGKKV
jgi:tetratricopeptide (TPR) repeat protein